MPYLIEIATTDFASTQAAVQGGADRIELCTALSDGGLTPSFGTLKKCRESFSLPIFPIIRPRAGDFLYTDEEYEIMLAEVRLCKELGFDGVVLGLLKKDGTIDEQRTGKLVAAAYPMDVSFHRAFDRCAQPFEALEVLVSIGCTRLLTSGQQPAAPEGAEFIKALVTAAQHRIIVMPGSGVRASNIKALAEESGATEFHSSLRSTAQSAMEFIHPAFAGSKESYSHAAICASDVAALRSALLAP